MNVALKLEPISAEDYLDGEEVSEIRHEYVGGAVFAMAGGTEAHSLICGNLFAAIHSQLRTSPCRVFTFDFKVRLFVENRDVFYYPDIMVACDPRDNARLFKRFPKVIIEVLSESTERTDREEKFRNYREIETLEEYVLVEQGSLGAIVYRRAGGWEPEPVHLAESELQLRSIDFAMRLSDVYARVEF